MDGLLVIDKPGGLTSRTALDRALRWFPRRTRMGHTGTLDPLATGVLVLCVGSATRLSEYVQHMGKTYRTRLLLGARSDTDDADGTVTPVSAPVPAAAAVMAAVASFVGKIEQVPPVYSAAKVTGRRAYDLARQGEEVSLMPRTVDVFGIDILGYAYPRLDLEVRCGKGTYIRSLARDLGERLGCGALVETLRRTRVGPFTVEEALTLEASAEEARARMQPLAAAVAELPRLVMKEEALRRLRQGQRLEAPSLPGVAKAADVAVFDAAGRLALVAAYNPLQRELRPAKVLGDSADQGSTTTSAVPPHC